MFVIKQPQITIVVKKTCLKDISLQARAKLRKSFKVSWIVVSFKLFLKVKKNYVRMFSYSKIAYLSI